MSPTEMMYSLLAKTEHRIIREEDSSARSFAKVNLSFLYGLLGEKEKSVMYYEECIKKISHFQGITLHYGLTNLLILSRYLEINKWISNSNSHKLTKVILKNLNIELQNSLVKEPRYFINNLHGISPLVSYFSEYIPTEIDSETLIIRLKEYDAILTKYSLNDYSAAHGLAGNLLFINQFSKVTDHKEVIRSIVNRGISLILENAVEFDDVIFLPGFKVSNTQEHRQDIIDNRFSWCYGTLGILNCLLQFDKSFYDESQWNLLGKVKEQFISSKNIDSRDINFCHGLSGNLYLLKKNQLISEEKYTQNLGKLYQCANQIELTKISIGNIYSHIDGLISVLFIDLLTKENNREIKKLLGFLYLQ